MKRIEVTPDGGGRGGAVIVDDGSSATVSTKADGSRVVNLENGARVTFMSVPKAPAAAPTGKPATTSSAVFKRVMASLSAPEQELLGEAVMKLIAPKVRGYLATIKEQRAEIELLKSRLAAGAP